MYAVVGQTSKLSLEGAVSQLGILSGTHVQIVGNTLSVCGLPIRWGQWCLRLLREHEAESSTQDTGRH